MTDSDNVAYDLYVALDGAVKQLAFVADCIERGLYGEALLHARSLRREKDDALKLYKMRHKTL